MPEKLVRDRIPEIIRQTGENPLVRVASGNELDMLIRLKVVEEANELLRSGDDEEIADLFEVLDALMVHRSIDRTVLEEIRRRKRLERGGFEQGLVLQMSD